MNLFVDAGNTRLKWQLVEGKVEVAYGVGSFDTSEWIDEISRVAVNIKRVAVSTVLSDEKRALLQSRLGAQLDVPVVFHGAEAARGGLISAYSDVSRMGADRWHAMYGAWRRKQSGFVVVDAGSAITVDYVDASGGHLGGYILPGKQMMLRSLKQDAARVSFESVDASAGAPGRSTTECVQHGIVWLWESLIARIGADSARYQIQDIYITGGDATALIVAGLSGEHIPKLVLEGLAAIDGEDSPA